MVQEDDERTDTARSQRACREASEVLACLEESDVILKGEKVENHVCHRDGIGEGHDLERH